MKIGIIGLGLMGGSFGRTLAKNGHTVYGTDISETVMTKAEMIGAMESRLTPDNAGGLDLLVAAINPSAFLTAVTPYLSKLKEGAVVMDFCGTKKRVTDEMKGLAKSYPNLCFIGGHPMAGREFSGIEHSTSNLFAKASMIFVPVNADIFTLEAVKELFLSLGFGEVVITTADNHDRMIAFTSQMCHVVSNAYIKSPVATEHFGYSAGSYKDMTRVARLNPEMWSELMVDNGQDLARELEILINNLGDYLTAIKKGDKAALKALLAEGNDIKLSIDSGTRK